MVTLNFSVNISAPAEKVWKSLWEPENYKKWTAAFNPGSYYKAEKFAEGERIHFLCDGNGMYSQIQRLIPDKYLAFQHIGNITNYEEQPVDKETSAWTGAIETYTLTEIENGTALRVALDTDGEYEEFMNRVFAQALELVKEIAENNK